MGRCDKAKSFLEKGYKQEPSYKGIDTELAFSYNCLGEYNKAIKVLKKAIKKSPKSSYTHKELIYAQIKLKDLDKASKSIKKAIKKTDGKYMGENIYNLIYAYYVSGDKKKILNWLELGKKLNKGNQPILNSINFIEKELKK